MQQLGLTTRSASLKTTSWFLPSPPNDSIKKCESSILVSCLLLWGQLSAPPHALLTRLQAMSLRHNHQCNLWFSHAVELRSKSQASMGSCGVPRASPKLALKLKTTFLKSLFPLPLQPGLRIRYYLKDLIYFCMWVYEEPEMKKKLNSSNITTKRRDQTLSSQSLFSYVLLCYQVFKRLMNKFTLFHK